MVLLQGKNWSNIIKDSPSKSYKNPKNSKSYEFAADYTNDPYYGKKDQSNKKYVIRGQAKKSPNSFYSEAVLKFKSILQLDNKYVLC